jgi:hypothetical protein
MRRRAVGGWAGLSVVGATALPGAALPVPGPPAAA